MSLLALNFSRPGTLGHTRRHWTQPPPFTSPTPRTIDISLGLAPPLVIAVREFSPQDGDVLHRSWVGSDGVQRTEPLAPYAVADPKAARGYVEGYVAGNYADAVYPAGTGVEAVRVVHEEVGGYYGRLRGIGAEGLEFQLLDAYSKFWFGLRVSPNPQPQPRVPTTPARWMGKLTSGQSAPCAPPGSPAPRPSA